MKDPRYEKLASIIVNHSLKLKKNERVLIEAYDTPDFFVNQVVEAAVKKGAIPIVSVKDNSVLRKLYTSYSEQAFRTLGDIEKYRMKKMDAYVGIRGSANICQMSDVSTDQLRLLQKHIFTPVHHDIRLKKKWVVLRFPSDSLAQQSRMSTEAFEDFFLKACTLDYAKMEKDLQPLKRLMERTDMVRIEGPGTDLEFSIKGMPAIVCAGQYNIPDGECFTAPIKSSVNGTIRFNTPSIYQGVIFNDIELTFKNGKVVHALSGNNIKLTERLNEILDTDPGARYVGEFSLGVNPYITFSSADVLFDEKIFGSFHIALGNSYEKAFNTNKSNVHWDMVMMQVIEYGGGNIYFDKVLIRKEGQFVLDSVSE